MGHIFHDKALIVSFKIRQFRIYIGFDTALMVEILFDFPLPPTASHMLLSGHIYHVIVTPTVIIHT